MQSMLVCSELGREGNADILRFSFFHGSQSHTPVATPELHNRSSVASGFCFILFFLTVGIQEGGVLCVGLLGFLGSARNSVPRAVMRDFLVLATSTREYFVFATLITTFTTSRAHETEARSTGLRGCWLNSCTVHSLDLWARRRPSSSFQERRFLSELEVISIILTNQKYQKSKSTNLNRIGDISYMSKQPWLKGMWWKIRLSFVVFDVMSNPSKFYQIRHNW